MVRMAKWVVAELSYPRQRERISSEEVVEVVESCFDVTLVRLHRVGDHQLKRVVRHDSVRSPNIFIARQTVAITGRSSSSDDLTGSRQRQFANRISRPFVCGLIQHVRPECE